MLHSSSRSSADRQRRSRDRRLWTTVLGAFYVICLAGPTPAAEGGVDQWSDVEVMMVTGQAGATLLVQETSSVLAFDAEELRSTGITDVGDLAEFTPNLEINSNFGASGGELFIRGVGLQDSNANAASAVAVISDGVYFNSPTGQLAQLFDIQSVGVLRGPQGSKYGRNASAGAIVIESARPSGEFGAGLSATYGRFNQVDLEAHVQGVLVPDLVSYRVAGKLNRRDPLGENRCGGRGPITAPRFQDIRSPNQRNGGLDPCEWGAAELYATDTSGNPAPNTYPASKRGVRDTNNWAARSQFLITPAENLELLFNVHGGQNRALAQSFQVVPTAPPQGPFRLWQSRGDSFYFDVDRCLEFGTDSQGRRICTANVPGEDRGDPFSGDYSTTPPEDLDLFGSFLEAKWTVGDWRFTSLSSYEENKREAGLDIDATPFVERERIVEDEAWQVQQLLRAEWTPPGPLSATLEGFFLHEDLRAIGRFLSAEPNSLSLLGQNYDQKTDYLGIAGIGRLELSEVLAIEFGIRMNYEYKTFGIVAQRSVIVGDTITTIAGGTNLLVRKEASEDVVPSGDVVLEYTPTSDVSIYGKFVRGYKGRHYNAGGTRPEVDVAPADPEFVNSFEIGFATGWLDRVIVLNGATFLYLYQDQQIFQVAIKDGFAINELSNAKDSRIFGVEADLAIRWEGFSSVTAFGWTYTEYSDFSSRREFFTESNGRIIPNVEITDFSGNRLVNSPEFSLTGNVSYRFDLGRLGKITPRFDYRFKDSVFTNPANAPRGPSGQPLAVLGDNERWVFDARLDYATPDGRLRVGGWVRNLTDEIYRSAVVGGLVDRALTVAVADPRTYGFTVTMTY